MALRDLAWGYCRHCHRDEEVVGGVLIEHAGYDGGPCAGSDTEPTEPPPEGTRSALTISPARPKVSVQRAVAAPAVRNWSWPWGRHRVIP